MVVTTGVGDSGKRFMRPGKDAKIKRHESAFVQPRRRHRVGFQSRGAVLVGCVRLSAGGVADAPEDRVRRFFGLDVPGATCKIGWIRIPGGAVIEIFHFSPHQPPEPIVWSRIGPTHLCLNVRGIRKWHDYLVGKGVEIVSPPMQAPRGHWLFFCRDFDGNLIEITDLGYMYHVL